MTESFASVNGLSVASLGWHVPPRGAWFLDTDLEDDSGTLNPGDACLVTFRGSSKTLVGRAMPSFTGTRALQRKLRIIAGAGGWGELVPAQGYHNDANIKASTAAKALALEIGETLGQFAPERERIGVDYARFAGPASRALEQIIGNVSWWVDYTGTTQVGERPSSIAPTTSYEVENFNPRTHVADLYIDSIDVVGVGSVIAARLDAQETIRSFDLTLEKDRLRMRAYCGPSFDSATQIETLIRKIVERCNDGKLLGSYRYRVASMNSDGRVNLDLISGKTGAPVKLSMVEQWPGIAGAHAELAAGNEVIVEFADDGDPTQPIITHFRGKQSGSFLPISLALLGDELAIARQGDLVQSGGPGTTVTFTPVTGVGAPPNNAVVCGVPHLVSFDSILPTPALAAPLFGAVSTGSGVVKTAAK